MSKQHNDNTGDFDIPDILPESATDTDLQELTAPLPETFTDLPEADEELTSSPTFALRDSGGGFPLVGDG